MVGTGSERPEFHRMPIMQPFRPQSLVDQVHAHLRESLLEGTWRERLPSEPRLVAELGVSRRVVREALKRLADEGGIQETGQGKRREISTNTQTGSAPRRQRVRILLGEPLQSDNASSQYLMLSLANRIKEQGHDCEFAHRSIQELGDKPQRLERMVRETGADMWIIYSAPRWVLEWFSTRSQPAFAIGGRPQGLGLANVFISLSNAVREIVKSLVALGHQRIVLIAPGAWRLPVPGPTQTSYLSALQAHGIPYDTHFNLPDWEDTPDGLERLLESLFRVTPPTALIVLEPVHCVAVCAFLADRSLRIPRDVSVISLVADSIFAFRKPQFSQVRWNNTAMISPVLRWVNAVAAGKHPRTASVIHSTFDPGGTIGRNCR